MGTPYLTLSAAGQSAFLRFRNTFDAAFVGGPDPGAGGVGMVDTPQDSVTADKYPIMLDSAGYKEISGGNFPQRKLDSVVVDLIPKSWGDGWSIAANKAGAPGRADLVGIDNQAQERAWNAKKLPDELIGALLNTNPLCWDGQNFFDTDHPVNFLDPAMGTYINTYAGAALTLVNLKIACGRMLLKKKPSGKYLGLVPTHLLVPPGLYLEAVELTADSQLAAIAAALAGGAVPGATTLQKLNLTVVPAPELVIPGDATTLTTWYLASRNRPSLSPWAVLCSMAPRLLDQGETSALYETKREVGVQADLDAAATLLFPQSLDRYQA